MIFDTGWKIIAKSALHRGFRKMQNAKKMPKQQLKNRNGILVLIQKVAIKKT